MRILGSASVLLVSLAIGMTASPAAAPRLEETPAPVTWSLSPADADGIDSRVSVRLEIAPGAQARDFVALTNFSPEEQEFRVYAGDGLVAADGGFDILPDGQQSTDSGSWVSLEAAEGAVGPDEDLMVTVPADSAVVIPFTVDVPDDATPGDHPAGIVAQFEPKAGSGVQIASRVGVRLHLRVTGELDPRLRPTDVRAAYTPSWNPFAPGSLSVDYAIDNTGNVRLGAATAVGATGPFGALPVEAADGVREVLPGKRAEMHAEIAVWPLLLGFGSVSLDPTVVGDDVVATPAPHARSTFFVWTVPWSQLGLLLLVAAIVVAIIWLRRRGEARVQARIAAAVSAAKQE